MLGLGNRHTPAPDAVRRPHSSRSVANIKSNRTAPAPATPASPAAPVGGFFSLSHWTRRILPASSTRKTPPHVDRHTQSPRTLLLEKDLPPTPPPHAEANTGPHPNNPRVSITIQHAPDSPPQPAFHVDVYRSPPIASGSQMNSIAFASFPSSAENTVRKSKSTHSLRSQQSSSGPDQQRPRGVSMTHMFGAAKRSSTSPAAVNATSPATPLVRKASFWSRKFSTSFSQRHPVQHLTVPTESPSHPALKTASPPHVDFTAPPALLPRSRTNSTSAGVPRRHSECTARHTSSVTRPNVPVLPQSPTRPSTADPYSHASRRLPARRPTTADSATPSHPRSFFTSQQPSSIPPSNIEQFSVNTKPPSKSSPRNPRPRSSTNPPLLHRLSINLFASSHSSMAKNGSSFSSGLLASSAARSSRPSLSQIPSDVLKPGENESSKAFMDRLLSLVSKAEIAGVLASAGDQVYVDSLKLFIERFNFYGNPLDVALRRLLMDVGLPRETQQIDRVIEAFGNRYLSCNPDLFTSKDHPYILAFSLIMLHTDAFNKSNRRKMSKVDYVKNTTLPGLIPEVLDCFYDNIVFAPFIFIEDPLDSEGCVEGNITRPSTSSGLPSPMIQNGNALLSRPKVDPYYLITNNLLDQLRVNVDGQISPENPFRWDGTGAPWNYDEILLDFARGLVVELGLTDTRSSAPFFGLSVGGIPSPSLNGLSGALETLATSETWTIKFTKVAVLNRKDDLLEGGKKPLNRKWRPYSVALTRSSLLLFRDLSWASILPSWNHSPRKIPIASTSFKPDEIISLNGALAVLDRSYSKHLNTFHLTTRDGRHILFQATEEKEMDEWISRINYASTFKTTGIRMRSLGMTDKVLELTGVAAATSHIHDLQLPKFSQPSTQTKDYRNLSQSTDQIPGDNMSHVGYCADADNDRSEPTDMSVTEIEGASQFQETFNTVKAELAAARVSAGDLSVVEKSQSGASESPRLASRSRMIRTRVEDLEDRICTANTQIDSNMHIARNIAILAPFQKSTRDRLQDSIQMLSKKIHAMRLDVTRLVCQRNILLSDLVVEEKNFRQATSLALQAATETLQRRYSEYALRSSLSSQELRLNSMFHEESPASGSHSFDSSTHDAFRSALDFGPDWPSSIDAFASTSLWPSVDSPTQGLDDSTGCYSSPDETSYLSLSTTNQSLPDTALHENLTVVPDSPEEQAEEWSKTRAAKRVSLVKLPSDLRISTIASKSSRLPRGIGMSEESRVAGTSVT